LDLISWRPAAFSSFEGGATSAAFFNYFSISFVTASRLFCRRSLSLFYFGALREHGWLGLDIFSERHLHPLTRLVAAL
jgi:hypothetical protein